MKQMYTRINFSDNFKAQRKPNQNINLGDDKNSSSKAI